MPEPIVTTVITRIRNDQQKLADTISNSTAGELDVLLLSGQIKALFEIAVQLAEINGKLALAIGPLGVRNAK